MDATEIMEPQAEQMSKLAWFARNDRGPHTATLPSGQTVRFMVPDSNALIRADRLPERLLEIALMSAAYPDGTDGYMADMAVGALRGDVDTTKLAQAFKDGLELRDWLISEMLVDPAIDPADVAEGLVPQGDIDMLIEFAERRRNSDHEGVRLPIAVLEEFDRFRNVEGGPTGDAAREGDGGDVPVAHTGADGADL